MPQPILETVRDQLAWTHGTLAAAQFALRDGRTRHRPIDWMIRAQSFAGL